MIKNVPKYIVFLFSLQLKTNRITDMIKLNKELNRNIDILEQDCLTTQQSY